MGWLLLLPLLALAGCTNINQMYAKYQQGDEAQFDRITEIVSRPDYPYATRRKAAQILGEIGDPRAVPILRRALHDYEQRTTLKQDVVRALAQIGDTSAVGDIGRLLDRSLNTADADIRMTAVAALGDLGGDKSAEILVNALRYYDLLMMREEQRAYRGVFTGEEQSYPFAPGMVDSLGRPQRGFANPSMGGLLGDEQYPQISMFGTQIDPREMQYNPTPEEREKTHEALVNVGVDAVPVIERFISDTGMMTQTLRQELLAIVSEINGVPPVDEP